MFTVTHECPAAHEEVAEEKFATRDEATAAVEKDLADLGYDLDGDDKELREDIKRGKIVISHQCHSGEVEETITITES